MSNKYKVITPAVAKKRKKRIKRESKKQHRRDRRQRWIMKWHNRFSKFLMNQRAKRVVKYLRKRYKNTGENTICIEACDFVSFALLPVLERLEVLHILRITSLRDINAPEFTIELEKSGTNKSNMTFDDAFLSTAGDSVQKVKKD